MITDPRAMLAPPPPMLALPARVPSRLPLDCVVVSDAIEFLRGLPDNSVDCVVTSPPYFGLRDYGVEGQIGLEPTPAEFVATMVTVFREVRRVLKASGTCWINLGDSYASGEIGRHDSVQGREIDGKRVTSKGTIRRQSHLDTGLPSKNLLGIPWRVAFALQDDGWILRSDIIWAKPNPMPESVTDRPTKAHEYVFLLTKAQRYFYDADAIREPLAYPNETRRPLGSKGAWQMDGRKQRENGGGSSYDGYPSERNRRSVWTVATEPTPFAHFATFPRKLIEPMILAGCPAQVCAVCGAPYERVTEREPMVIRRSDRAEQMGAFGKTQSSGTMVSPARVETIGWQSTCKCDGATRPGVVLDMFMGSGTVALVARHHNRHFVGCDLNPAYVALARERLRQPFEEHHIVRNETLDDLPLFAQGATHD